MITVFANQKGGVGKTAVVAGAAHAAAAAGCRVLVIDVDPQGNTTKHLTGYSAQEPAPVSLADVLDRDQSVTLTDAALPSRREGISVVASGGDGLQAVMDSLIGKTGADISLARAVKPVRDEWDYVFLDTRPATDLMTRNAFMAADNMVVVLQPEGDAIEGYEMTQNALDEMGEYLGKNLPIVGFVVNLVDGRRKDHAEALDWIRQMSDARATPILGDPIPSVANLARLTLVGMGVDEIRADARLRNIGHNFGTIIQAIKEGATA